MLRVAPRRDSYCPDFDSLLCLPLSEPHVQLAPPWLRESCQGVRWGANQRKKWLRTESLSAQRQLGLCLNHTYSSDKRVALFPEGAISPPWLHYAMEADWILDHHDWLLLLSCLAAKVRLADDVILHFCSPLMSGMPISRVSMTCPCGRS